MFLLKKGERKSVLSPIVFECEWKACFDRLGPLLLDLDIWTEQKAKKQQIIELVGTSDSHKRVSNLTNSGIAWQ